MSTIKPSTFPLKKKPLLVTQLSLILVHISRARKKQLIILLTLMILSSISEVISISALIPFLAMLVAPEKFHLEIFAKALNIEDTSEYQFFFVSFFILAVLLAGSIRLFLAYYQNRLSADIGKDLSDKAFGNLLYQKYEFHSRTNSSESLSGLVKTNNLVSTIIQPTLIIFSSGFICIALTLTIVVVTPLLALVLFLSIALIYILIYSACRRKISRNSDIIGTEYSRSVKIVQEAFGGIRSIITDATQRFHIDKYRGSVGSLQNALAINQFWGVAPKHLIEVVGIVSISLISYVIIHSADSGSADLVLPILGATVLGVQRLLPTLQQVYAAFLTIRGAESSIADAIKILELNRSNEMIEDANPCHFRDELILRDVSFRYAIDRPYVLKNTNLTVKVGSRIGIKGRTGAGKSTLIDIILGLIEPTAGTLIVDGIHRRVCAWTGCVTHVPQEVFLADGSVTQNIAFSIDHAKIDMSRVYLAARMAQIDEVIEHLEDNYNTLVGERGAKLSGGQRQRIGIARALYKQPRLLILDEATSALDVETEAAVMDAIHSLGNELALISVSHRDSAFRHCDLVMEVADGGLRESL